MSVIEEPPTSKCQQITWIYWQLPAIFNCAITMMDIILLLSVLCVFSKGQVGCRQLSTLLVRDSRYQYHSGSNHKTNY